MNVLGIPGSLREYSLTSRLLLAALRELPDHVHTKLYFGIADMPHFSPDIDTESSPVMDAVQSWRSDLNWADAIVICTPEYAFGLPGSFKNILDWAVSSGEFCGKPVVAISSSPLETGGAHALAALIPTLRALGTKVLPNGAISVPFLKNKLSSEGEIVDPILRTQLNQIMSALVS